MDDQGLIMTEWQLSAEELQMLFCGGHIRLWTYTFNTPFQPVTLDVVEPDDVVEES